MVVRPCYPFLSSVFSIRKWFFRLLYQIFHLLKLRIAGKILACTIRFNTCRHNACISGIRKWPYLFGFCYFFILKKHNNLVHSLKHQIEEHGDLLMSMTQPLCFFSCLYYLNWLYDVEKDDQSFSFTCERYGNNIKENDWWMYLKEPIHIFLRSYRRYNWLWIRVMVVVE